MSIKFFVANWKMQLPCSQALNMCMENLALVTGLANSHHSNIILCPSFEVLWPIKQLLNNTPIALGAQTCSAYSRGAYTGQVSAESLAQLGCSYCIVGHSERRLLCNETIQDTVLQVQQLLTNQIQPIICIGETQQEYAAQQTMITLQQQLEPIFTALAQQIFPKAPIYIAYEPVWAIGSGVIPERTHLIDVFSWLRSYCDLHCPTSPVYLLYGGSVNISNSSMLGSIPPIQGLLIGSGSLDFQKFKNIVSSILDKDV